MRFREKYTAILDIAIRVFANFLGIVDTRTQRSSDMEAGSKVARGALPPQESSTIFAQNSSVFSQKLALEYSIDSAFISVIYQLHCASTEVHRLARGHVFRTKWLMHTKGWTSRIEDDVFELTFTVLNGLVDGVEGFLHFETSIVALFEDLLKTVDGIEQLVDDLVEVFCCECVRLVHDEGQVAGFSIARI
jgi:hypothetical protein